MSVLMIGVFPSLLQKPSKVKMAEIDGAVMAEMIARAAGAAPYIRAAPPGCGIGNAIHLRGAIIRAALPAAKTRQTSAYATESTRQGQLEQP